MVWTTAPVEAFSSLTVLSLPFATQTWVPSEETPNGECPTGIVCISSPLEAFSSLTALLPWLVTQTRLPSEETPFGLVPTGRVWTTVAAETGSAPPIISMVTAPPNTSDTATTARALLLNAPVPIAQSPLARGAVLYPRT